MKILSFGSLNYDYTYEVEHFLAPKETLAAKSMQRGFGGKGANQSIAFARAGLSVYHAGRVDADGQPFVDYLKQNGIHTDYQSSRNCRAAQRCSGIHPGNQRVEMNDTEGHVDILVCMAGTGGTGFGTVSYLRSRNPNPQVVLVQPHPDSRLTPEHPDAQIIDGVLPAYDVPESALSDYLRPDWSDACINVRTEEAYEMAHEVLRAEGLFLGTSAAAALHAAVQVGRRPENQGKNIVVIVPDNGMKYLSTPMYRQK